jgi:DNA-directed RNA polymerase specialized sigma24 family protein
MPHEGRLSPSHARRLKTAQRRFEADQQVARDRFRETLILLRAEGASVAALARALGVSRQAVHDRLKRGADAR